MKFFKKIPLLSIASAMVFPTLATAEVFAPEPIKRNVNIYKDKNKDGIKNTPLKAGISFGAGVNKLWTVSFFGLRDKYNPDSLLEVEFGSQYLKSYTIDNQAFKGTLFHIMVYKSDTYPIFDNQYLILKYGAGLASYNADDSLGQSFAKLGTLQDIGASVAIEYMVPLSSFVYFRPSLKVIASSTLVSPSIGFSLVYPY